MSENNSKKEQRIEQAREFWEGYDIPFDYATAIKVRRSGLMRGSSGTGRARDTVVHMHVKEAFVDGRLRRSGDSFLCEKDSHAFPQSEEGDVAEGVPQRITCDTCLKRMERWEKDG